MIQNTDIETIAQGLSTWMGIQQFVSEHKKPIDVDDIATHTMALIVELSEMLQETNWKYWKPDGDISLAKIAEEFADVMAFIGILLVTLDKLGIPPHMLAEYYAQKSLINIERFTGKVEGYK